MNVERRYKELLDEHGRQGWWPLLTRNDDDRYDQHGYHPGVYDYIDNDQHRFEIYAGSILTQNTKWTNARQALKALLTKDLLSPSAIQRTRDERIAELIEPARYYNQKTQYLKAIAAFFQQTSHPTRTELLDVTGVGEETADTILTYAHGEPRIIADTYTKRWLNENEVSLTGYDAIQAFIDQRFPRTAKHRQELHALIVNHQK